VKKAMSEQRTKVANKVATARANRAKSREPPQADSPDGPTSQAPAPAPAPATATAKPPAPSASAVKAKGASSPAAKPPAPAGAVDEQQSNGATAEAPPTDDVTSPTATPAATKPAAVKKVLKANIDLMAEMEADSAQHEAPTTDSAAHSAEVVGDDAAPTTDEVEGDDVQGNE
jgi:hypothetical protein